MMNRFPFVKKILLFLCCFSSALVANIQDDRKQLEDARLQLYIVQKQNIILEDKLAKEEEKSFNITSIRAHKKLLETYQEKEAKLHEKYTKALQLQALKDAKYKELENKIPLLKGDIQARIDISDQIMNVYKGGSLVYSWFVSTAAEGLVTPTGAYQPYCIEKMHFSKQFGNQPMPWSVFFKNGYAIHATKYVGSLGHKASHGCIRLDLENAHKFFKLVQQHGYNGVKINIAE